MMSNASGGIAQGMPQSSRLFAKSGNVIELSEVVDVDQFCDISSMNEQVAGASSRSLAAVRSYSEVSDLICRSTRQIGHGTE